MAGPHHPVVERHSWVWVWPGDPALADPALIPNAVGLDDPHWTLKTGQRDYEANYQLIKDKLLDFSHLSDMHKSSFGADEQWARASGGRVSAVGLHARCQAAREGVRRRARSGSLG